jgi:hypothetical protein
MFAGLARTYVLKVVQNFASARPPAPSRIHWSVPHPRCLLRREDGNKNVPGFKKENG